MIRPQIILCVIAIGLILGLSACTNPYDPVQRFVGGGLIGAGSGAAIGAAAAGGHGAALGAAVGGVVGAVTGLITTPTPPAYHGSYNHRHYGSYNHRRYASYLREHRRGRLDKRALGLLSGGVILVASAAPHGCWLRSRGPNTHAWVKGGR